MPPVQPLPLPPEFKTTDEYISSLLKFFDDPLFQTLCGGVHILDFFTRDTSENHDLYHSILPQEWIDYFETQDISSILNLLMQRDLTDLSEVPPSLLQFIAKVRGHSLRREFVRREKEGGGRNTWGIGKGKKSSEWALTAGMKPKKVHEVEHFSAFVDDLVHDLNSEEAGDKEISHILDFGSGQAYLSRTLAKKYGHHVVGIESRTNNIDGAKVYDERFENLEKKRAEQKAKTQPQISSSDQPQPDLYSGTLQYIEKRVSSGSLDDVVCQIQPPTHTPNQQPKNLLLISLHSCGNLVHHALRSFLSTPSVRAVALIGCCYNLLTEKLSVSHQPPFRELHPRLLKTSQALDPAGFPMSEMYTKRGLTLNITARMMACQAPQNWTQETSEGFFKRHFYRALLQRIFYDKALVSRDHPEPVIIGSLRKKYYDSFYNYVTGAIEKLGWRERLQISEEEVAEYEQRFGGRKKDLSVVWSLMAFTAGVVESLIVVDRWLFLTEAEDVKTAWVEVAFEYAESPRNLVVVGVR